MSLHPEPVGPVPDETARVARAAFPRGTTYLRLRDELGVLYTDEQFAALFPARGQSAEAPWRLALVTVFQFAEGLSDRQAAEAVRARLDWKYALGLDLTDPGFDYSVLCEFRARLLAGGAEAQVFEALLARCKALGLVKARGRQRTDSTHVLAAIRALNRLEVVGETLRAALNALAVVAPDWLREQVAPVVPDWAAWAERYGPRVESARLAPTPPEQEALATTIGADGCHLLAAVYGATAPAWLREVPAVETLRRVWVQQFYAPDAPEPAPEPSAGAPTPVAGAPPRRTRPRWRAPADLPPSALRIDSPYDPQARWSQKRQTTWVGYTIHVTETCDPETPHLVTNVESAVATTPDVALTAPIHDHLAAKGLPPGEHAVDAGYVDAAVLVSSRAAHGIDVVGPVARDTSWQAQAAQGFALGDFGIDWATRTVTCPQGHASAVWSPSHDETGNAVIHVRFAAPDCHACASRAQCTRAARGPRSLKLRPQAEHEALQAARRRQATPEFQVRYATRAGIEGTLSQGTRCFGLRRARYIGHAKTRLQHLITAAAINLARLDAWWTERPLAQTRRSTFARLAAA